MSLDFRADQLRSKALISSGSQILVYPISVDGTPANRGNIDQTKFNTSSIGTDVFLFFSGSIGSLGTSNSSGTAVFGGDLRTSGAFVCNGGSTFLQTSNRLGHDFFYAGFSVLGGPVVFTSGLSGSLQRLATGQPYIIGSGITVNTNSIGQISLTGSSIPTPAASFISLGGYNSVDATEGTKVAGGLPLLFRSESYAISGFSGPVATLVYVGYVTNNKTGSLVLWDLTSAVSVLNSSFSSSVPNPESGTPTWNASPHLYELRVSSSGTTVSDYAVINNAAIKLTWS